MFLLSVYSCLLLQGQHGQRSMLEINMRYGMEPDISNEEVQAKLKDIQVQLKKDIQREMRIKEAAEKLREQRKQKKASNDVNHVVKEANQKLDRLKQELQEVESFLVITHEEQGQSGSASALARRNSIGELRFCPFPLLGCVHVLSPSVCVEFGSVLSALNESHRYGNPMQARNP